MRLRNLYFPLFLFLFLGLAHRAQSHEMRPAYLQIKQVSEQSYRVLWKVPRIGDMVSEINPEFPNGFELETTSPPRPLEGFMLFSFRLEGTDPIAGKPIRISGLNRTMIDVLVHVDYLNGERATLLLQPDSNEGVLPGETDNWTVIKTYTGLGIEHILIGIDHLLFVLALILITKGFTKIVKTITAFTVAHSITLSLATLGLANLPGPPVEAVIALSIVFLALEIVRNIQGQQTLTSRKPWLVAFTFGLLHGFGFAGALVEIGLPQSDIPLALAFFNIGVELGQIFFVIIVLGLIRVLSLYKHWPKAIKKVPAYAIGAVAAFWVFERISGFWA